ncbi:hypothetical protein Sphch_3196 [Sphingobium chlorophenolicum L-1]|uniref:Uncharacterized protein n=1 Tax=Sphingobium chlorophenolicum L-1 TaxID=690566 RepID=F6F2Z8_SPHCR|nr:hypothetical protein Sphch_3196 [Sphingobium chlorophenolicum L-1]
MLSGRFLVPGNGGTISGWADGGSHSSFAVGVLEIVLFGLKHNMLLRGRELRLRGPNSSLAGLSDLGGIESILFLPIDRWEGRRESRDSLRRPKAGGGKGARPAYFPPHHSRSEWSPSPRFAQGGIDVRHWLMAVTRKPFGLNLSKPPSTACKAGAQDRLRQAQGERGRENRIGDHPHHSVRLVLNLSSLPKNWAASQPR